MRKIYACVFFFLAVAFMCGCGYGHTEAYSQSDESIERFERDLSTVITKALEPLFGIGRVKADVLAGIYTEAPEDDKGIDFDIANDIIVSVTLDAVNSEDLWGKAIDIPAIKEFIGILIGLEQEKHDTNITIYF
jgi:hypothetical protein